VYGKEDTKVPSLKIQGIWRLLETKTGDEREMFITIDQPAN